jgi:hypothetical protein
LQNLNEVEIYLVFGKGGYRITGGEFLKNIYFSLKNEKEPGEIFNEKIKIIKNIFNLIEKVFVHNENDEKIFQLLEKFIDFLGEIEEVGVLKEKEILFLAKLFYLWGYFDEGDLPKEANL